ncbi:MAG: hypothetical protein HPY76_12135 [Anaerolineae bacterium]|jgi:hypothetical protein|nr:hypothetical protein [Anaerolineae bacterium]
MMDDRDKMEQLGMLMQQAKDLAKKYKQLTGKTFGITGEVAEYEAARLLGLTLLEAGHPGCDAVRPGDGGKIQIKGRVISRDDERGRRIGGIRLLHEWDKLLFVLLDEDYEPYEIYEADRKDVIAALAAPGSKARAERGALGVSKFKSISQLIWKHE